MVKRYEFVGEDDADFIEWDKGTLVEYDDYEFMRQALNAKVAKLVAALTALQSEHYTQADCWQDAEQRGTAEVEGHSAYHMKWANFCKKALEESNG